eukprot:350594-Chlamydomonas_euryale.AAC.8
MEDFQTSVASFEEVHSADCRGLLHPLLPTQPSSDSFCRPSHSGSCPAVLHAMCTCAVRLVECKLASCPAVLHAMCTCARATHIVVPVVE